MGGTVAKYPQVVKVPATTWPGANSRKCYCVFLSHALFYMENSVAWVLGNAEGRFCWEAADFSISCISVEEPRGRVTQHLWRSLQICSC